MSSFIVFMLFLSIAAIEGSPPLPPPPPSAHDFALVVFQWPLGLCKASKCLKAATAADFTMHGIWPQYANGTPKLNCATSPPQPYNSSILQNLTNDLDKYWPSFKYATNDLFWQHEWEKHGTCSGQSLYTFFQISIAFADSYCSKIMSVLKSAGIVPSSTRGYKMHEYSKYIEIAIGRPSIYQLQCLKKLSNKYFVEMRLCVDENLQGFIKCPLKANDEYPGCGTAKDIALFSP